MSTPHCSCSVALLFLSACSPGTTLSLVLAPDPAVNAPRDVAARVRQVRVVVDAAGGLEGVNAAGDLEEGGTAVDVDGDGLFEVLFVSAVLEGAELPLFEIGLSHNADRELQLRLYGYDREGAQEPQEAIALGGLSASCERGEQCSLGVPFNLRAAARPPKVLLVAPPDGTSSVVTDLPYITVVLSTTVRPETVDAGLELRSTSGHEPPLTTTVSTALYSGEGLIDEERSLLQIRLGEDLRGEDYSLSIGAGIIGTNGRPFDQLTAVEGESAFTSRFSAVPTAGGGECPVGFVWVPEEAACVAVPDCSQGCPESFVCSAGECVEDCRVFGACIEPTYTCSQDTGVCAPL